MDTSSHVIRISVPEETTFDSLELTMGTGDLNLEGMDAKTLFLHQGTGKMILKSLAAEEATLECGDGLIQGEDLQIYKQSAIFGSMGEVALAGNLGDQISIDGGTAKTTLTLDGRKEDYAISGSFFARNVFVDGNSYASSQNIEIEGENFEGENWETWGNGEGDFSMKPADTNLKQIVIDGGVGEVHLFFDEEGAVA